MEKKTQTKRAVPKNMAVAAKIEANRTADVRRFVFEHGLRQRVKSVTREGRMLYHISGARFGSAMQRYVEECPSEREAAEALSRIAEEYGDKGYRELSGEAYAEYASGLRFSFLDEDLRGLFMDGAPLAEHEEKERAVNILKSVCENTEIAGCKRLELCFPGATLNALFANWEGAPLENLETLALRVPNSDEGSAVLPCGALNGIFPKLKNLRLRGDADWELSCGCIESLCELCVEGNTFTLPSVILPNLTALDLKLTQAASLKSGESFGLYEDWGVWCRELSAACPVLQRLAVDVSCTQTLCELLEELLRPSLFPSLTDLMPGCFGNYDGDELCGVLAQNVQRISELKRLTLQVRDSGGVAPLVRRLQAFPLRPYVWKIK